MTGIAFFDINMLQDQKFVSVIKRSHSSRMSLQQERITETQLNITQALGITSP